MSDALDTFAMDGLFTPKDIKNRFNLYMQCSACRKWTLQTEGMSHRPCNNCGEDRFDPTSARSMRTYIPNAMELAKRKPKMVK